MTLLRDTPEKSPDELPPALASMWRLFRLGYTHEPGLIVVALVISLVAAVPDALIALCLKFLADGAVAGDGRKVLVASLAMAGAVVLTWLLSIVSSRVTRRFRDKVTIALETHVASLQAGVWSIEHHERRDHLDRLSVLRHQIFVLDHMYLSVFSTLGWVLRLAVTVVLLVSIHPLLALLVVFSLPTVVSASWRPAVERRTEEATAQHRRLAEHLFATATTAAPGKEVRVTGIGASLVARRRAQQRQWYGPVSRARWGTAAWEMLGWTVFGLAYVGAVVFVASGINGSAGDVLLILAAGARLSSYVGATMSELGFLRGIWLDGSRRLVWLERYSKAMTIDADRPAPDRLAHGIRLDHVSFRYPGSDELVLDDVSLDLPAGAVVAVVGENGAGKSTLVKLLCKMYEPSSGQVLVDGEPLSRIDTDQWRQRLAGALQDFFKFELPARTSVGVGDLPHVDDDDAVRSAVDRAGADDVVERLERGLDTQLGPSWPDGVDVSFGQWQKLGLARGFMRDEPLLLVLDEPTAALDAQTEHDLFGRYATASRAGTRGGVTVLVSHRFSTVRMADLIVVLDGSRLAQVGTHAELMEAGGQYAQLYNTQAASYR
jgi:ATP-binding cassette subfamily B protein